MWQTCLLDHSIGQTSDILRRNIDFPRVWLIVSPCWNYPVIIRQLFAYSSTHFSANIQLNKWKHRLKTDIYTSIICQTPKIWHYADPAIIEKELSNSLTFNSANKLFISSCSTQMNNTEWYNKKINPAVPFYLEMVEKMLELIEFAF